MNSDSQEFAAALAKGSGRAMVLLRRAKGVEGFKEALIRACICDLTYDRQCEHERSEYLVRLIVEVGAQEEFFTAVASRLPEPEDGQADRLQMFSVLSRLAAILDESHRSTVRQFYSQFSSDDQLDCMEDLVRLDGVQAFIRCAERLENSWEDEGWRAAGLLAALTEREGGEGSDLLISIEGEHPHLANFVTRLEAERQPPPPATSEDYDFEAIRADLSAGKWHGGVWLRKLSDTELQTLAEDFTLHADPETARQYLRLFAHQAYPLDPQHLIRWRNSVEPRISWAALRALGRVCSPIVRELAVREIEDGEPDGVRLLLANFQSGDFGAIVPMFRKVAEDEAMRDLGLAVLSLLAENDVAKGECEAALLEIYRRTPCSLCRGDAVSRLAREGLVPAWMAEECHFDADPDTTKLV